MGLMVLHRAVQNRGARFAGVESETSYEDRMQKQCPDCPKCLPVMLNDSPKCRSVGGCPSGYDDRMGGRGRVQNVLVVAPSVSDGIGHECPNCPECCLKIL